MQQGKALTQDQINSVCLAYDWMVKKNIKKRREELADMFKIGSATVGKIIRDFLKTKSLPCRSPNSIMRKLRNSPIKKKINEHDGSVILQYVYEARKKGKRVTSRNLCNVLEKKTGTRVSRWSMSRFLRAHSFHYGQVTKKMVD